MKKRLILIGCVLTVALLSAKAEVASAANSEQIAADVLVVRPVSFVGTVLGSVVFVVTLPFTAPCHGVHAAAQALVVKPAKYTFTRELGDVDTWDIDAF